MARILVVDEDTNAKSALKSYLEANGHTANDATDWRKAVSGACSLMYDLIIVSASLPRNGCGKAIKSIMEECPDIPVLVTANDQSIDEAVKMLSMGAMQYILKPVKQDEATIVVDRTLDYAAANSRSRRIIEDAKDRMGLHGLVSTNEDARNAHEVAAKAARANSHVLIVGEAGTGKTSIARAIHIESSRSSAPFVRLNCRPDTNSSEIDNWLLQAESGTAYLDGVEKLKADMQARLLDVIKDSVSTRIIASTDIVPNGSGPINSELLATLREYIVAIPPLRHRKEDIPGIVAQFIEDFARATGKTINSISEAAMASILLCEWPGNVRELRNCIEHAVIVCDGCIIQPTHLILNGGVTRKQQSKLKSLWEIERDHIKKVLLHCKWNRTTAATILEIDRKTLRSKIRQFGFAAPEESKQDIKD